MSKWVKTGERWTEMPELPEVETIKNELLPRILGRQIVGVSVHDDKPIRRISSVEFSRKLRGQKINGLERRGKYLIFHLSKNVLVIHLRMTGNLLFNPKEEDRFIRVVFHLDDGGKLVFSDRRRLGVMWLSEDEKEIVNKLGPEPLAPDFTSGILGQRLKGRKAPIKAILLDQAIIAGVGNMYADEALFEAKIHPLKKAGELSGAEIKKLHKAIIDVLNLAIERKGASVDTYIRPEGNLGTAHDEFKVAHRKNGICPRCGGPIKRIVVRNRGSYFCPVCQRLN
jgi:formamidopyrimidine-DNA glycosylase